MDIFWSDKAIFIIVDDPFPLDIPSSFCGDPQIFWSVITFLKALNYFFISLCILLHFWFSINVKDVVFLFNAVLSSDHFLNYLCSRNPHIIVKEKQKNWYIIHSLYKWKVTWNYFYNRSPLNPTLFPVNVYCRLLQYTPKAMFMVGMGRSQELV